MTDNKELRELNDKLEDDDTWDIVCYAINTEGKTEDIEVRKALTQVRQEARQECIEEIKERNKEPIKQANARINELDASLKQSEADARKRICELESKCEAYQIHTNKLYKERKEARQEGIDFIEECRDDDEEIQCGENDFYTLIKFSVIKENYESFIKDRLTESGKEK